MTALACPRETALKVCGWATDPDDARHLLDALGLLAQPTPPVAARPCALPPGVRHGSRSAYNRYRCRCGRCTFANRVYVQRWRRRSCCRPVVTHRETVVVVLDQPAGHGRHRAWPGQLALALEEAA